METVPIQEETIGIKQSRPLVLGQRFVNRFKELRKREKLFLAGTCVLVLLLVAGNLIILPFLRDSRRRADLGKIVDAVYSYSISHNGRLPDTDGVDTQSMFPKKATCIGSGPTCFDLAQSGSYSSPEKVVPDYLPSMPKDVRGGSSEDTGYKIYKNSDGQIVASAKGELTSEITVVR